MRRMRLAIAVLALSFVASASLSAEGLCPNIFTSGGTGVCAMTGRTGGNSCVCEYNCDVGGLQWYSFCDQ